MITENAGCGVTFRVFTLTW